MTHEELVAAVLAGHGAVFSAGLVATVVSWPFKPGIEAGNEILAKIRRRIIRQLGMELKPVLETDVEQVGNIFGPDGAEWRSEPVRFLEGEEFGNALFHFIEDNANTMADYRLFRVAIERCRFWAQYFAYGLFILMVLEMSMILVIWGGGHICEINIPDSIIKGTILIPILTVTNCFVGFGKWLYNCGKSRGYKDQYE